MRKRLRVFRVEAAGRRSYFVADPLQNQADEFEPWQFFVLEVLSECENLGRLSAAVEERYGHSITQEDVDRLFTLVAEKQLFGASARTTRLVADFNSRRPRLLDEKAQDRSRPESTPADLASADEVSSAAWRRPTTTESAEFHGNFEPDEVAKTGVAALPPAVRSALEIDRGKRAKGWRLFDPTKVLHVVHPLSVPLRHAVYLMPFLVVPALVIAFRYHDQFAEDLFHWFGRISILWHAVMGLLTVNLLATFVSALVAYNYGVSVSAFCLVFYFVVWPRFMLRVGSVDHLPRRGRLCYYAAPLLTRLAIFSIAMLVWFDTRDAGGVPAKFSIAIAIIAQFSFLLTVIPLRESNGYRILSTMLDAPKLREKATSALHNRLRGGKNWRDDDRSLVVYALASTAFVMAVIAVFLLLLGRFFAVHLGGGATVLVLVAIGLVLGYRIANKVKKVTIASERATRFAAWRSRGTQNID
jgi:putative peptide zinc metalloprotease protein